MTLTGGGTITSIGAVASRDGQHILAACASTVRIYSAVTSAVLVELKGHTDDVTAVVLEAHSQTKVYSASLDGTVRLWDFQAGTLLSVHAANAPIKSLVVPAQGVHAYLVTAHATGQNKGRVMRLNTSTGALDPRAFSTSKARPLAVSEGGGYVSTVDKHTVHVWSTKQPEWPSLKLHSSKALTCVAIDAGEERIAAGDVTGRIHLWNAFPAAVAAAARGNAGSSSEQAGKKRDVQDAALAKETLHWHAGPVSSLAFSPDGTYLLSGGREAVLVMWRLDSGARTFLPRLQGALTTISPAPSDPACYIITQADNTIRLVNMAAMRVVCSIHGLRPAVKAVPRTVAALVPGTGQLALAGEGALLQIFDTTRNRHVDKVQVGHRNVASTKTLDAAAMDEQPVPIHISHIAFSADGASMATVDVHPSANASSPVGCSLKFWDRRSSGASATRPPLYSLNSHVADPHRAPVTGLAYSPKDHMAASVSGDGRLAIWQRVAARPGPSAAHTPSTTWRCFSTSTYRDEPMSAVAFSGDGSLVAGAVPGSVTLWDPHANSLVAVLAHPAAAASVPMASLSFIPGTPYLVGTSTDPQSQCLVVWNLLTASVWWSAATPASCLAVDAKSGAFAVALPREPVRRWVPNQAQAQLPQLQGEAIVDMKGKTPNGSTSHTEAEQDSEPGTAGDILLREHASTGDGAAPMDVDGAHGQLLGPEQHAALRSGVFWCDRPGSQAPDSLPGDQQQMQQESGGRRQPKQGMPSEQGSQQAGEACAVSTGAAVAGAAAAAVGQPAEGSFMYGGGGGTVLLFEAGNPCPQGAWLLPRSSVAALAFLDEDSAFANRATSAGSSSPLLILTEDRQYHIATSATSADSADLLASADLSLPQDVGAVKGGWEAAFGPLQPQQRAGQKPSAEAREAVPTVEALWDAPSHALPAPSLLVNASLEALLGGAA